MTSLDSLSWQRKEKIAFQLNGNGESPEWQSERIVIQGFFW